MAVSFSWPFTDVMTQTATNDHPTTLVLGAAGKTGSRVAQRLTALGCPVRAGSRTGSPPFDWADRTSWGPALAGVGAVYLCYQPDLGIPGAADVVGAFVDQAVAARADRIVLLSGRGEPEAQAAEDRLRASGADWTIVRCAFFSQNFTETWREPVRQGVLAVPAGDNAEPFLDVEDVAEVASAALTDHRHIGQVHELTGPRLITFQEAAAELSAAIGREVRYLPVSRDEFAAGLATAGLPAEQAGPLATLITEFLDGRNSSLTDGVQRALGRRPREFTDFVRAAAASGVWDLS
jgi:uncharacterized protein YbjT (DUF2867 family)